MNHVAHRYLLNEDINRLIKDLKLYEEKSVSFYTVVKLCKEIKYSKVKSKYYQSTRNGIFNLAKEKKVLITKNAYKRAEKSKIGNKIKKSRYQLFVDSKDYHLERYRGKLKKLNTLVYNIENIDKEKILPTIISSLTVGNVTNDERYLDKNLALFGDPQKYNYNIYSIFKDIELGRIKNSSDVIFQEMQTGDALRIVLFKLLMDIKTSHDISIQTDAKGGLKELSLALRKSIFILNEYKDIFDQKIVYKVLKHLKIMNTSLKKERDLKYIKNLLLKIDNFIDTDEMAKLKSHIDIKYAIEKKKIVNFFSTREFAIIFRQYELLLKENSKTSLSNKAQKPISKSTKKTIFNSYKKSLKLYDKYEECEDSLGFSKTIKSFKKLKTILTIFDNVIDYKEKPFVNKNIDNIILNLSASKDIKRRKLVVQTYLDNLEIKPKNYKEIREKIQIQSQNSIEKNRKIFHNEIIKFQKKEEELKKSIFS